MATPLIRFGTRGWRAVVAEEFTFASVRVVWQAFAAHLLEEGIADRGVIVGYDAWFLFRPSGTEPLVRCYAEGDSPARVEALLEAGKDLVVRP